MIKKDLNKSGQELKEHRDRCKQELENAVKGSTSCVEWTFELDRVEGELRSRGINCE